MNFQFSIFTTRALPSQKGRNFQFKKGFSLIEVLLAVSLLGLLATGIIGALLYGQESTVLSGKRASAAFLAEEGIEAVRNIRDNAFTNLTNGTYGLTTTGNTWNFTGSSDTTDIYTRAITISQVDTNRKEVTSTVTWQQNAQRSGTVSVVSYITNWQDSQGNGGGIGTMASGVTLGTSSVNVDASDDTSVIGLTLQNTATASATIDKMTVSWAGGSNGNKVDEIIINAISRWTGNSNSGALLDITNVVISPSTTLPFSSLSFNKSISTAIISLEITMTDGSTKTFSGIAIP